MASNDTQIRMKGKLTSPLIQGHSTYELFMGLLDINYHTLLLVLLLVVLTFTGGRIASTECREAEENSRVFGER